jgi:hypothetical protein
VGDGAGSSLTTGNLNICIGASITGVAGESNTIRIGDNLPNTAGQSACYIGGIAGQTVDPSGAGQVYIDNSGKLGVFLSSQRFKRNIKPMGKASEAILRLQPVTFHYKTDMKNTPCFGLIAEEVEKISPELVTRDKDGKLYGVRYDQVNAMLLNEFLKEHRKVEDQASKIEQQDRKIAEQDVTIAELKKEIKAIVAHSKEQDLQIQRVRQQAQMRQPTLKVALVSRHGQ